MARGLLYVESRPSAPERVAEYHAWYNEIHLPEVVALDGIVSARRLEPVDDDAPFVALYELDAEDLTEVLRNLNEAAATGKLRMSDALQMDPPPLTRLLEVTVERAG